MKDYIKLIDGMPFIVRLIFAFPGIDGIIYGIYRIAKGKVILGLIWIIVGFAIFWIIDLYSLLRHGKLEYFV